MAQYWTTWTHHSAITSWERTDAQTLRAAKCVATQRHGGQLSDAIIKVGETMFVDDHGMPCISTVAQRGNHAGARWGPETHSKSRPGNRHSHEEPQWHSIGLRDK